MIYPYAETQENCNSYAGSQEDEAHGVMPTWCGRFRWHNHGPDGFPLNVATTSERPELSFGQREENYGAYLLLLVCRHDSASPITAARLRDLGWGGVAWDGHVLIIASGVGS